MADRAPHLRALLERHEPLITRWLLGTLAPDDAGELRALRAVLTTDHAGEEALLLGLLLEKLEELRGTE